MRRRAAGGLLIYAAAAFGLTSAGLVDSWYSVVFLPLILTGPGVSILVAFGDLSRGSRIGHACLALGLSFAVLTVGGIPMSYLPGGLDARAWAELILGVSAVCFTSTYLRPPADPPAGSAPTFNRSGLKTRDRVIILVLASVSIAALVLAGVVAIQSASDAPRGSGIPTAVSH